MQGFTTLGGKSVLFVIILKKKRPLNYNEKHGYDLEAPWIGEGEKLCDQGIVPTLEQLETNQGPKQRFPGPINCKFNGKTIPSLVLASKGGGVNEDILVTALKHLDDLNVFPRGKGQPNPTLLLDGHGSRLQPKFVQYINNLNPDYSEDRTANHRWNCALGLPNSTHHWQVGDSPEENQAFKYHSRVKKDSIRDFQDTLSITPSIKRHHVVPICQHAIPLSFMQVSKVKKAVAARGWNPLNQNCLHDKEIIQTKVSGDMTHKKDLTPAELACVTQGEDIVSMLNFQGDVVGKFFDKCNKRKSRLKAQEDHVKKRQEEYKRIGMALFEITGKVTSGKLYANGVADVNNESLINLLRLKKGSYDHIEFVKECKRYVRLEKNYKKGESCYAKINARKERKKDAQDTAPIKITNEDLDTLIKWKWSAVPEKHRPKASNLKIEGGNKAENRQHKLQLWEWWQERDDPLPPERPLDFELYIEGVNIEEKVPDIDVRPISFPRPDDDDDDDDEIIAIAAAKARVDEADEAENKADVESCELLSDDGSSKALGAVAEVVLSGYDWMDSLDYGPMPWRLGLS